MKKLLMALAACATTLIASAAIKTQEGFEAGLGGFTGNGGKVVAYDTAPSSLTNYPFASAGQNYCDVDADETDTLVNTNGVDATYFDMYVQFPADASTPSPDIDEQAKIAVYVNSSSNVVVVAGDGSDGYTEIPTEKTIKPGTWARLTIAKVDGGYMVYVNGVAVRESSFAPINSGDPTTAAFTGVGKLDNYVARTTDPFIQNPAATIGGEGYASLSDALVDAPTATPQLEADASLATPLAYGESISVKLNNHTLSGITSGLLVPVASTSGDVTTYTADYFPRTATAGQDGTAANPFEVADVDDLQALSAAVAADAATFAGKCYVQTANIDMTSADAFSGIGTYEKVPTSGTPFTGTYNGQGYTIANVTRAGGNTQGIFNQVGVGGVIENLVVSNMVADAGVTKWGFAIVGNAGGGATLRNLTAAGTFASNDNPSGHNIAGIVVRVCGGATAGVTTTIESCTNNATIYGGYTKLGGICAIVQQQAGFMEGGVAFNNCANNGSLICRRTKEQSEEKDGAITGNAGIIGYTSASNVVLTACSGMGTITNTNGANTDKDAALIGYQYGSYPIVDNGGNSAPAGTKMIATYGNANKVTGFRYATVDNGVATTVSGALAKDTTYLLECNVAASETPVFTLAEAGDTIAFDTALGYTFAGTVAVDTSTLVPADPVTEGTVTTYGATAGVASVDNVAYATFADAVAALEGETTDDFVTLLANVETTLKAGDTLRVKTGSYKITVNKSSGVIVYDNTDENDIMTFEAVGIATFNGNHYTSLSSAIAAWASADVMVAYMNPVVLKADVDENITIPVNVNAAVLPLQMTGSGTINGVVTIPSDATFQPVATVLFGDDVVVNGTLVPSGNATLSIGGDLMLADGATLGAFTLTANSPVYTVAGAVEVAGALNVSLTSATLEAGTYTVVTGASVTRDEGADVVVYLNNVENDNWVLSGTSTELTIAGAAATVGGEKFASFAEAAAAADGVETITLLASASYTLTVGETLIVEAGEFTMTVTPPAGYALAETAVSEGVVAYATQQYVAQVQNPVPGTATYYFAEYYTSLAEAVANAEPGALVTLLADDRVSFAGVQVTAKVPSNGSIVINKNLTINGAGFTVYGNTNAEVMNATGSSTPGYDMVADLVDGSNLLGFFVKGGNVTFNNVTLTEFGDTAYVNKFGYTPIQTASAYTGTLTLNNVNFSKFNRTAVCVRGGTLSMTGGTIAGGTVNKNNGDYFQQPVEVRGGTATISGVTITGGNDIAGNGGGAIVAWSAATLNNVTVNFTGKGVWSDGPTVAIVGESTSITATGDALFAEEAGTITVAAGDFTGPLAVDSDPNSSIVVSGGTFDRQVPAEFCADGKVPTTTPDAQGKYTVVDYVPPSGIDPASDEGAPIAVDTTKTPEEQAAEAQTKADAMDVQMTAAAETESVDQATWNGYFTKTAEKVNDVWVAKAELNPAVVLPVDGAKEKPLTEMLESVAAAAIDTTGSTTAEVPTKAGLYYWIAGATEVNAASYTPGDAVLGDGTTQEIGRPTLTGENGKAFFKVCVDIVAPTKE